MPPVPPVLLDTDTLSEVMRGRKFTIRARALEYVASQRRFTFSIITRYEILRGLKARGASTRLARFERECQASVIVPLTDEIVIAAADIYATLYRAGQLIGDADVLIAATAMVRGLPLVTNNLDHFERVQGLAVASWQA
jgi:tRNA(fMet)-specific endonuclease VapC